MSSPLIRFLAVRLAGAIVTLLLVSIVVFVITAVLPGDVATRILGRAPLPDQLLILRERLGLDQPLVTRYFHWLWQLLQGDLGTSLISGQSVAQIVGRRLMNSALLAAVALAFYFPIAVFPALIQATHRDRPIDHLISAIALGLLSFPDFLLGTVLLILFAVWLPLAPARSTIDGAMNLGQVLMALILPALTIAIVMGTYAMRYLRDSLVEVLGTEYVRSARLNGIPNRLVMWRHALPNALVPALNITSLNLTYLFGGVVVVEQVFAFPGFGALLVGSLMQLDIPLIQVTVLIASAVYVVGNLLVDIVTMLVNPRLRYAA